MAEITASVSDKERNEHIRVALLLAKLLFAELLFAELLPGAAERRKLRRKIRSLLL